MEKPFKIICKLEGKNIEGERSDKHPVMSFPRVSETIWTDQDSGAQSDASHRLSAPLA